MPGFNRSVHPPHHVQIGRSRPSRNGGLIWSLVLGLCSFATEVVVAQTPQPVGNVRAVDHPDDNGTKLIVAWELSSDDSEERQPRVVIRYEIERRVVGGTDANVEAAADESAAETANSVDESAAWKKRGDVGFGVSEFVDDDCQAELTYQYRVQVIGVEGRSEFVESEPVSPVVQWWDSSRTWFAILLAIVSAAVVFFIDQVRRGKTLKIRRIAGLDAVTEAVGRATEMGRPCLFVPGIQDINNIQTVAGITILSRVARIAAEYDAPIEVPTARALVMTTARETMQAAYFAAGRPDAYNEDQVYYVTDEQFGYVASVTGTMVREKPAACFYMGAFYAESLILAETGNSVGAIQVAGTAMPTQLPFFVAACDYTLIGEEFFAASAYLSGEPQQLGSLKGQDTGKVIAGLLLIAGCLLATLNQLVPEMTEDSLKFLTGNMLGKQGFLP